MPVSERKAQKALATFTRWLEQLDFEPICERRGDIQIKSLKLCRDIEIQNLRISWWRGEWPHFYFDVNNDWKDGMVGGDTFEVVVVNFRERMVEELQEILRPTQYVDYWGRLE